MGLGEVLWGAKGPANLEFNTWHGKPEASPNTIDRLVFIQGKVPAAVVEGLIGLSMGADPMAADIPYRNHGLFLPSFVSSTVISWLPYTSGPETTGGLVNGWTSGCCAKCVKSGTFELPKLALWPVFLWISGAWDSRATTFCRAVEVGGWEGLDADPVGGINSSNDAGCCSLAATECPPQHWQQYKYMS